MVTSVSTSSPVTAPDPLAVPTLRRRLVAMLYEGLLLFGVMFDATAVFLLLRLIVPPLARADDVGLQVWGFLSPGLYSVWSWCKRGQTSAMQTWHMRVVDADGSRISLGRTIARYLLAWVWAAAAVGVIHLSGASRWTGAGVALVCPLVWGASVWFDPQCQFLHDCLTGTRLVRD